MKIRRTDEPCAECGDPTAKEIIIKNKSIKLCKNCRLNLIRTLYDTLKTLDYPLFEEQEETYIKPEDLELGKAYLLKARNIDVGIWDGKDFHGLRYKFGDYFIFPETHYDLDEHYGTAKPIRELK